MPLTAALFRSGHSFRDGLADAPNPKPTSEDKERFGRLASLYTAFSVEFASYALDLCLRSGCTVIADPFSGMGTLAEAARTRPVTLLTSDLSPFAALSSTFRSSAKATIFESVALFEQLLEGIDAKNERQAYDQVLSQIASATGRSLGASIERPSGNRQRTTALMLYLAALSRIVLYRRLAGSNPTWIKKPEYIATTGAALRAMRGTISTARQYANQLPALNRSNRTKSSWSSIEELRLQPGSLDAIVTSPPYANRTDYIRHYLPASELLLSAASRDERQIRAQQIGTPLIRKHLPSLLLPATVWRVLEEIRTHPSYASERYYYKGFLYYFSDMHDALSKMRLWLRKGGLLFLVVQDTYYKDVYVPTADLLIEVGVGIGLKPVGRKDWKVRHHLSRLSPHSRQNFPNRTLIESMIAFSR